MKMYLLWEPMKEVTHPQGETEVCALSCGHSTDTLISGSFFFFSLHSAPYLCLYALFTRTTRGVGWGCVRSFRLGGIGCARAGAFTAALVCG